MALHISQENLPSRRVGQKVGFKPFLEMVYMSGGTKCSILWIKINPRVERLARQFGRRQNDVMNSPACFQGMGHCLQS